MAGKEEFRAWLLKRRRSAQWDCEHANFGPMSEAMHQTRYLLLEEAIEEFERLMPFWDTGNVKTVVDD